MSSELNKIFCAILSAILVYLLASFLSELLYNVDNKKATKLSYNIENVANKKNKDDANIELELKKISESELIQLLEKADLEKGKSFVNKNCASCHDFKMPIKNKIGPSLATILDRKIGNLADYKYSKTLLNIDKKWNIVNLYYFLEKPKEWAPGTKMSYRGISDSQKLLNTIKYLRENSISNEN
jgi:cytochrome c